MFGFPVGSGGGCWGSGAFAFLVRCVEGVSPVWVKSTVLGCAGIAYILGAGAGGCAVSVTGTRHR